MNFFYHSVLQLFNMSLSGFSIIYTKGKKHILYPFESKEYSFNLEIAFSSLMISAIKSALLEVNLAHLVYLFPYIFYQT